MVQRPCWAASCGHVMRHPALASGRLACCTSCDVDFDLPRSLLDSVLDVQPEAGIALNGLPAPPSTYAHARLGPVVPSLRDVQESVQLLAIVKCLVVAARWLRLTMTAD